MHFIIDGELCDLNTYIKALNSSRFGGNAIKQEETQRVAREAMVGQICPVQTFPVVIRYLWVSRDQRKDLDNIAFAKKFVMDGLVQAGVLPDDSRRYVAGFSDSFAIDKERPRVEVTIEPA